MPAFADLDGDGDLGLVLGRADGYPLYFRNDGTPTAPHWTFVPGGLGLTGLGTAPLYTAPAFADLDGNGRPDLLLGWVGGGDLGRVAYYHNNGNPTSWTLVSSNVMGVTLAGHPRPALGNLDHTSGRNVFDLLVGGAGFTGNYLAYFRNDGTKTAPVWTAVNTLDFANIHVTGNAMPCLADMDGDGNEDLLVGTGDGRVEYYRNFGAQGGVFAFGSQPTASTYGGVAAGHTAAPTVADLMGQHRFDLFVAGVDALTLSSGRLYYIENRGTPVAPTWAPESEWQDLTSVLGVDAFLFPSLAVQDVDGDGLPDLVLGDGQGTTYLVRCLHGARGSSSLLPSCLTIAPTKRSSAPPWATSTATVSPTSSWEV